MEIPSWANVSWEMKRIPLNAPLLALMLIHASNWHRMRWTPRWTRLRRLQVSLTALVEAESLFDRAFLSTQHSFFGLVPGTVLQRMKAKQRSSVRGLRGQSAQLAQQRTVCVATAGQYKSGPFLFGHFLCVIY